MRGLATLILVLMLSGLAVAQQQYYGTTAVNVLLSEPADPADAQHITIHPGDTITLENVRASIAALYATGHYQTIEADAVFAGAGGVNLTFRVRQHYYFSTLRLEPENLLPRSLPSYVRSPVGEKFSTGTVEQIVLETRQLLERAGYYNADIQVNYGFDESTRLVSVTLNAGVKGRARVGAIQIHASEETFSPDELHSLLGIKVNDEFSADRLQAGIGRIREKFSRSGGDSAGGFLDPKIDTTSNYRPESNTIDLEIAVDPGKFTLVQAMGYDIPGKQLRTLIPIFEEGAVDSDLVEEGRSHIVQYMQKEGYFEATARADAPLETQIDNAVQITYVIEKGSKHDVGSILFEGNHYFTDKQLRERMKIQTGGWFGHGTYNKDLLAVDTRTLAALYRSVGYEVAEVLASPPADSERHDIDIVIHIVEGPRYTLGELTFYGNLELSEKELLGRIQLKPGEPYAPGAVAEARNAIAILYYSKGFPDIHVDSHTVRDAQNSVIEVSFQVAEGQQYKIGRIIIAGNKRTAEKIVSRNSGSLYPDTPYNPETILDAQQKLYATGLFNRVEVVPLERNDESHVRDLLIHVEDAQPIQVTYGLGIKEYQGVHGTLEVSHTNLFGLDRSLTGRIRGGLHDRFFQSTYHEPRLFNRNIEGFASLAAEKSRRPLYNINRVDFLLQTIRKLSLQTTFVLTAGYQTVNLQDINIIPAARRRPDISGVIQIARVGASVVRDHRDDAINPQRGSFSTTTFQVADRRLGSEVNFTSIFNQSSVYRSLSGGVLALSVRLGLNKPYGETEELPISERYFAGGSSTLRGFKLDKAGPLGGGQLMTIGNVEFRRPLRFQPIQGIGAAVFYDTGTVFERPADFSFGDFTHTIGAGLRYQSPIGTIRLDMGFNLDPKIRIQSDGGSARENRTQVYFTLGQAF